MALLLINGNSTSWTKYRSISVYLRGVEAVLVVLLYRHDYGILSYDDL